MTTTNQTTKPKSAKKRAVDCQKKFWRRPRNLVGARMGHGDQPVGAAGRGQKAMAHKLQRAGQHLLKYSAILAILIAAYYCFNDPSSVEDFVHSYRRQYRSIIHNRANYCDRAERLSGMVKHAQGRVLHQDVALGALELALDNSTFNSIALVGTSGVGKSHTARVLREKFPWPENVKTLAWEGPDSVEYVESMLSHLVLCGQNMIIIDNMTPEDRKYVAEINKLISSRPEIANGTVVEQLPHLKYLTIVYLFSINRLLSDVQFKGQNISLQRLQSTHVINYRMLETKHVKDCIAKVALEERVRLTPEQVQEIVLSIDATNAGCKPVRAKALMYGVPIDPADKQDSRY